MQRKSANRPEEPPLSLEHEHSKKRRGITVPYIDALPNDLLRLVMEYFSSQHRLSVLSFVCKRWREIVLRFVTSFSIADGPAACARLQPFNCVKELHILVTKDGGTMWEYLIKRSTQLTRLTIDVHRAERLLPSSTSTCPFLTLLLFPVLTTLTLRRVPVTPKQMSSVLVRAPLLTDLSLTFDPALLRSRPARLSSVLTKLYFEYNPELTNAFDVEFIATYKRISKLKELSVREETYEAIRHLIVAGMSHLITSIHLHETLSYGPNLAVMEDNRGRELYLWQHCLHIKRLKLDYGLLPMPNGCLPRLRHLEIFFINGYEPEVTYLVSDFLAKCLQLESVTFMQDTVALADELDDVATVIVHRKVSSALASITLYLSEDPAKDLVAAAESLERESGVRVSLKCTMLQ